MPSLPRQRAAGSAPESFFRYAQHNGALVLLDFQQTVTGKDLKGLSHRRDRHAQFLCGVFQRELCALRDAFEIMAFRKAEATRSRAGSSLMGFSPSILTPYR